MHILVFATLQLIVSGYAILRGGAPERAVAIAMIFAAAATGMVSPSAAPDFKHLVLALLVIDLFLFLLTFAIALTADRFWPLWMAALQLAALAIHGVRVYDPSLVPYAYAWTLAKSAYLMLFLLVAGVWRHRARTRSGRAEYDWSVSRRRKLRDDETSRTKPSTD